MQPTLFALKRAYQAARNALEIALQPTGLTAAQLDVLKLLPAAGLDQRALQAELGITSATLTRLLAGMQRRGLVTRSPHPSDARGKTVRITSKARRLRNALMAHGEAAFAARLLRGFTRGETAALTEMLSRIADNMSRLDSTDDR